MKKLLWEDDMKILFVAFFVSAGVLSTTTSSAAQAVYASYEEYPKRFHDLTGMTPEQLTREPVTRLFFEHKDGCITINHMREYKTWVAGTFKPHSVRSLENDVRALKRDASSTPGKFNVLYARNFTTLPPDIRRKIDIAALQAQSANAGAIFHIFSSTDCKNTGADDNSSSARAAMSALPGIILRHYHAPSATDLATPVETLSPCKNRVHGHISFAGQSPSAIARMAEKFTPTDMNIGVHLDVRVPFGVEGEETRSNHLITQILTTYVNFDVNATFLHNEHVAAIARNMLMAAYKGTMHAAAVYGEQTTAFLPAKELQQVFITLPNDGIGLTRNELEWIYEAINACQELIKTYGLDVTLILPYVIGKDMQEFLAATQEFADATEGYHMEIRTQSPPSPPRKKSPRLTGFIGKKPTSLAL